MAEYVTVGEQAVLLNQPIIFSDSIPCRRGLVYHADETGVFILRGAVSCPTARFARYEVTFSGNISLPEGGTPGSIAVSISENGESRPSSLAIVTPAAAEEYFNVTSTATVDVPAGCCFSVAVRHVAASADPAVTPAPVINVQNGSLRITRVA